MKKKMKKETKNKVIEIHIYVHQMPYINNPNGTGTQFINPPYSPLNPPYYVTC